MRPHIGSLYLKVVLPIVLLVLAAMALMSYVAMRTMKDAVGLVARQRALYGLTYVRTAVEDVGDRGMVDRDHLQTSLERLNLSPDVDAARILSLTGKVLYSSQPAEVGQTLPIHLPTNPDDGDAGLQVVDGRPDVLHASSRIVNHTRCSACHGTERPVLAYVDLDISLSRQTAGMRSWGSLVTTAAIGQFVVIGAGVVVILGVVVVRPIRRLGRSMNLVQHGRLDVQADRTGTTEIDELVGGFNDMVWRLQRARHIEQEAQRKHLARVEQLATLGEVAASLAHEIRNPLAGTKAAIDVLAGEATAEEPQRILRHASRELGRVDGVVRQLLNYAKPKAPVLAAVDLRDLIDNAVELAGPRAAAQNATLTFSRRKEPLQTLADADMVLQVIVNLVLNALQATQGVPGAAVDITATTREGTIACSFRDNGPGVPRDRADLIFKPFMTTKSQGTGLGLAISRRLIELHGGRLWLENPGAAGACFTFTLPASDGRPQAGA